MNDEGYLRAPHLMTSALAHVITAALLLFDDSIYTSFLYR
jgi:hypothetical protein